MISPRMMKREDTKDASPLLSQGGSSAEPTGKGKRVIHLREGLMPENYVHYETEKNEGDNTETETRRLS